MFVFNYDPQTLQFIGGTRAEFDQLDPGRMLVPAFATRVPIPMGCNFTTEWPFYVPDPADPDGGSWEIRPIEVVVEQAVEQVKTAPASDERKVALLDTLEAHLQAAQRIREELTGQKEGEAAA